MRTVIDVIVSNLPTYADLYKNATHVTTPDTHRLRSDAARIVQALRDEGYKISFVRKNTLTHP